ncbi:MAG TPA: hypothetical protein VG733_08490 [Chthoniobacteraceae bacterium]|nr:hypothetical protein [Chthoniobacteraceae bacterium]
MKNSNRVLLAALLAGVSWCGAAPGGTPVEHTPKVIRFDAGLVDMDTVLQEGGELRADTDTVVKQTEKIPLTGGTSYGFVITFRNALAGKVRIEFELPKAPKTWGDPDDLKAEGAVISADGRTYTREFSIEAGKPVLHIWNVADGDPEGVYILRFYMGNSKEPFRTVKWKFEKP